MSAKCKKISVDEKTYAEILAYRAKMSARRNKAIDIGDAAVLLIEAGLRQENAGMWNSAFANSLRNVMREVAEADRLDRETQLNAAVVELSGQAISSKAALFAILLVLGYTTQDAEFYYQQGLEIAKSI